MAAGKRRKGKRVGRIKRNHSNGKEVRGEDGKRAAQSKMGG